LTEALTHGIHHVGLAVRDLDEATGFFCGTLGFKEVARNDAYPAVFVSDGVVTVTIWRVTDPGVMLEFTPEPVRPGSTTHHFICAIPGGLRIEFATRPS
jgi:catechol 2,3-dioxygenase-like lactoylglutathione lyase family enzyme